MRKRFFWIFLFALLIGKHSTSLASTGTIVPGDDTTKVCHDVTCASPSPGFLNFRPTGATAVVIDDSAGLSGSIWGDELGWITLNPTGGGVVFSDPDTGLLTGKAWSQVSGWVNFAPTGQSVTIDPDTGEFSGWAWTGGPYGGWIKFDCSDSATCIKTTWRNSSGGGGGGGSGGGGSSGGSGGGESGEDGGEVPVDPIDPVDPVDPPPPPPPRDPLPPDDDIPPPPPPQDPIDPGDGPVFPPDGDDGVDVVTNNPPRGGEKGEGSGQTDSPVSSVDKILSAAGETLFSVLPERAQEVMADVADAIESPAGAVATTVATSAGLAAAVAQTAAGNGIRSIIGFFGLRRRRKKWGTVYDSVTKQPLDPAYVVAYDQAGNEVATAITDLDGRYGFILSPGQYTIVANKTHYQFPSTKMKSGAYELIYHNLYFGEPFVVTSKEEVIARDIPMDPMAFDWNEAEKGRRGLFSFKKGRSVDRVTQVMFLVGFAVSVLILVITPKVVHLAVFAVYVISHWAQKFVRNTRAASVVDAITNAPISFAVVRVYTVSGQHEVIRKVTSLEGNFYCLIPNGTYYLTVEERTADGGYVLSYTSPVFRVTKGVISDTIKI